MCAERGGHLPVNVWAARHFPRVLSQMHFEFRNESNVWIQFMYIQKECHAPQNHRTISNQLAPLWDNNNNHNNNRKRIICASSSFLIPIQH